MRKAFYIIAFLAMVLQAHARKEVYKETVAGFSAGQQQTLNVTDLAYADMRANGSGITLLSSQVVVEFNIIFDDPAVFANLTGASIDVLVDYDRYEDNDWAPVQNEQHTIELFYTPESQKTGRHRAALRLPGGGNVTVRATAQTLSGYQFLPAIAMSARIEVDRLFPLDYNPIPTSQISHNWDPASGDLQITWPQVDGAEYYDLEWAYVNDYDLNDQPKPEGEIVLQPNLFRNNSSRVSLNEVQEAGVRSYQVPLLYEHGYIVYRVRAVGKVLTGNYQRYMNARWSSSDGRLLTDYANRFFFEGHATDLNWQATRNFAEEGKSKSAVSYFDGSLRNRQVVSKINTENEAIVGETIYDSEGRANVQVLPVPANNERIKFYPEFNLNQGGTAYSWRDFDVDMGPQDACTLPGVPLSDASGAAQYYSPNNPNREGHHRYLPDAEGYPFTQIEYERDNTGRIKQQSGVGQTFQLGTTHSTRYYYDKANQEELDIVFGTEVGDAARYKKNTVIDPNGQASISYLDPQGRVVATALAGKVPENLQDLEPIDKQHYTVNLINGSVTDDNQDEMVATIGNDTHIDIGMGSIDYSSQHTVTTAGEHVFNYEYEAIDAFEVPCEVGGTVINDKGYCATCVLDLHWQVLDECNNEVFNYDAQTLFADDSCVQVPRFNRSESHYLGVGAYTISKHFTINREKLEFFTEEYLATLDADCYLTYNDFLAWEYEVIDTLACEFDCEACLEKLDEDFGGIVPQYGDIRFQEYQDLVAECEVLCGVQPTRCELSYMMLLSDVSPHGQYGGLRVNATQASDDDDNTEPGNDPIDIPGDDDGETSGPYSLDAIPSLSVFNEVDNNASNNLLPKLIQLEGGNFVYWKPDWRHPFVPYTNDDGSLALIACEVITDDSGAPSHFEPAFYTSISPFTLAEPQEGETVRYIAPQYLVDLNDYLEYWQRDWARSLVFFHPEYGYYNDCKSLSKSNEFERTYLASTFSDAKNGRDGFGPMLNSMGTIDSEEHFQANLNADPFYNGSGGISANDWEYLEGSNQIDPGSRVQFYQAKELDQNVPPAVSAYYSIWEMAYALDNCPLNEPSLCPQEENCSDGKGVYDQSSWEKHRSFYIDVRQQYQEKWQVHKAKQGGYFNGCIGEEQFNAFNHGFSPVNLPNIGIFSFLNFIYDLPCTVHTARLYEEKQPIFPMRRQMLNHPYAGGEFCEPGDGALETNYCPELADYIGYYSQGQYALDYYNRCGQCPQASLLELFLHEMTYKPTTGIHVPLTLGCSHVTEVDAFSDPLMHAMGFGTAPNGVGITEYTPQSAHTNLPARQIPDSGEEIRYFTVDGTISNADDVSEDCKVFLKIMQVDEQDNKLITDNDFNPDELIGICCLHHQSSLDMITPSEYTLAESPEVSGKVFTFEATYNKKPLPLTLKGEGYTSCLVLDVCTLPELCAPSKLGLEFIDLFSHMAYGYPADITTTATKLTADFSLSTPPFQNLFLDAQTNPVSEPGELNQAGIDETWSWNLITATDDATVTQLLNGRLINTGGIGYDVRFEELEANGFPVGTDVGDIVRFSAFRPDINHVDPGANWLVKAHVKVHNGDVVFVDMKVSVTPDSGMPELLLMSCTDKIEVNQQ